MHWHVEKLVNEFIEPLSNDLLSTTATNFGSQGWSLFTSLTVLVEYTKRKVLLKKKQYLRTYSAQQQVTKPSAV